MHLVLSIYVLFALVALIASAAEAGYVFSNHSLCKEIYLWLLPFTWIAWYGLAIWGIVSAIYEPPSGTAGMAFEIVMALVRILMAFITYRDWKNKKDDRWKRLRKKAASKVKALDHKLVVVPTTSNNA